MPLWLEFSNKLINVIKGVSYTSNQSDVVVQEAQPAPDIFMQTYTLNEKSYELPVTKKAPFEKDINFCFYGNLNCKNPESSLDLKNLQPGSATFLPPEFYDKKAYFMQAAPAAAGVNDPIQWEDVDNSVRNVIYLLAVNFRNYNGVDPIHVFLPAIGASIFKRRIPGANTDKDFDVKLHRRILDTINNSVKEFFHTDHKLKIHCVDYNKPGIFASLIPPKSHPYIDAVHGLIDKMDYDQGINVLVNAGNTNFFFANGSGVAEALGKKRLGYKTAQQVEDLMREVWNKNSTFLFTNTNNDNVIHGTNNYNMAIRLFAAVALPFALVADIIFDAAKIVMFAVRNVIDVVFGSTDNEDKDQNNIASSQVSSVASQAQEEDITLHCTVHDKKVSMSFDGGRAREKGKKMEQNEAHTETLENTKKVNMPRPQPNS